VQCIDGVGGTCWPALGLAWPERELASVAEPRQWGSPSSPVLWCFQDQAGMLLGVLWCRLDGWFLPGGPRYSRLPCTVAVRPPASMFSSVSGRATGF